MKNFHSDLNHRIYSRLKLTVILSLIAILSFNPSSPAFAALTIGAMQGIGGPEGGYPSRHGQAISTDNNGRDYIAWTTRDNISGHALIKARTYINNIPATDEVRVADVAENFASIALRSCTDGVGNVYLVWYKSLLAGFPPIDIFFSRSADYGATWEQPLSIHNHNPSEPVGITSEPDLQCDSNGGVYIVWKTAWINTSFPFPQHIFFTRSLDYGSTWLPAIRIDDQNSYIPWYSGQHPHLALGREGFIHIVWTDARDNPAPDFGCVYVSRSADFGATWKPNIRVSHNPDCDSSESAYIAADTNGNVYAAFKGREEDRYGVFMNSSSDDGQTWLSNDQSMNRLRAGFGDQFNQPFAADNKGNVYVALIDFSRPYPVGPDIVFNSSSDFGQTWGTERKVVIETAGYGSYHFSMAADQNGRIYVFARQYPTNGWKAQINASRDFGRTWECGSAGCLLGHNDPRQPLSDGGEIKCNQAGHSAILWTEATPNDNLTSRLNYANFLTFPIRSSGHEAAELEG